MKAVERMRATFAHQDQRRVPRGELWLGSDIFRQPGFNGEDSLRTHIKLCQELGMDFLSLPVEMPRQMQASYRRFSLDEMGEAVSTSGLFTCVVVDGPFQRSVERPGDLSVLSARCDEPGSARLQEMASAVEETVAASVKRGVSAVVIADDIAYQRSTYASPQVLRERLLPLYSRMVDRIHGGGAYALFHSDGNITALIPDLISCGLDGLAGCEPECLDLMSLKAEHGSRITFMSGISAGLLETGSTISVQKQDFVREVQALTQGGGFVLCSACGINSGDAVECLKTLYAWVDEAL
jgi:uroporphyrinogen decarboxylase